MKKIGIASDHGGFALKETLRKNFHDLKIKDYGTFSEESVDYPDYISKLMKDVASGVLDVGIALCGTGIGASIVANKAKGIRAALCHNEYTARMSRAHNNANVLVMGGRVTGPEIAFAMVHEFLTTAFDGGRHERRINKISNMEKGWPQE